MPIICKIQLDATEYKTELDNVLKLTEKAQADMSRQSDGTANTIEAAADQAVQKVGSAAEKATQDVGTAAEMTSQVIGETSEAAAEAGSAVSMSAKNAAQDVETAAGKGAESVINAAEKSAKSMDAVKNAAKNAASAAAENVEKQGDAAKKVVEKTGNGMKAAAGSIKSAAGAASGVVSALGGVSPQLGFIGQALQTLLSGPVAAITAAVAVLISAASTAWDICTTSAEEYRKKLAAILDLQGKVTTRIREGMDSSERYLTRLEELDRIENKGNAAKAEQARLLEILTRRYGDLGIAIDKDTGKMSGLEEARKKIRGDDASKIADSLQKEFDLKVKSIPEVEVEMSSGNAKDRARLEAVLAGYDPDKVQRSYETVSGTMGPSIRRETMTGPKISMREERAFLADYLEKAEITDEKTTEAIKARIDALDDILKTSDEISRIRTSGYSSESDETEAMSAETAKENQRESVVTREKQFTQNRELAAMPADERAEALRKLIREEEDRIDRLGKMPETDEDIFKSRQRRYDLQKQLDALDDEKQRRRDEEDDAYAAGLTPVEKAELLRGRLAAAQKTESGYREKLSDLEKPGDHGAADEDRKLDLKEKIVKAQERILDLTKRVADAEAEARAVDQEAQGRVNDFLDAQQKDLEIARLEAAAEYEKADALKLANELQAQNLSLSEKELETAKELAKERNAAALKSSLKDQSLDLLDAAKRKAGLDEEADTDRAIREAEKTKRGKLSAEEEDYVRKLTQLSRAVSGQEENPLSYTSDLSVKTNELTARGGFASGAVMPSVEQVNKNILSEIQNARNLLSRIQETVEEGLST